MPRTMSGFAELASGRRRIRSSGGGPTRLIKRVRSQNLKSSNMVVFKHEVEISGAPLKSGHWSEDDVDGTSLLEATDDLDHDSPYRNSSIRGKPKSGSVRARRRH